MPEPLERKTRQELDDERREAIGEALRSDDPAVKQRAQHKVYYNIREQARRLAKISLVAIIGLAVLSQFIDLHGS